MGGAAHAAPPVTSVGVAQRRRSISATNLAAGTSRRERLLPGVYTQLFEVHEVLEQYHTTTPNPRMTIHPDSLENLPYKGERR